MSDLRLVIFDVDGTLVDSQNHIFQSMEDAYTSLGFAVPSRTNIRRIVGLSLPQVFATLSPELSAADRDALSDGYKTSYMTIRQKMGAAAGSPLFPKAREVLDQLHAQPNTLLAVATGKSKRGLDHLIDAHGMQGLFVSTQVADHHPSKPHPSMILQCLNDAGVEPHQAVMIGDTTFDMDMGAAAGVSTIGVSWGYHPIEQLKADRTIDRFEDLPAALDTLLEPAK
ncbi:MAG: HAD-IA family hydrolase [Aliishimia sp.]